MKNAIVALKAVHLAFLFLTLLAFAIIPLCFPINHVLAFVVIPILFVCVMGISVFIDQKLTLLLKQVNKIGPNKQKHHKSCPTVKGLCC